MVSNILFTWESFIAIVLSQLEIAPTDIFRGAHRKTACCLLPAATKCLALCGYPNPRTLPPW